MMTTASKWSAGDTIFRLLTGLLGVLFLNLGIGFVVFPDILSTAFFVYPAYAQGLNAIPAPTVWRTRSGKGDPRRFLPSSTGLAMSERAMHEYVGLLWARLRGEL